MFVNIRALAQYLSEPEVQHRKDLIVGSLFCRVVPIKDLGSKWYGRLKFPKVFFSNKLVIFSILFVVEFSSQVLASVYVRRQSVSRLCQRNGLRHQRAVSFDSL